MKRQIIVLLLIKVFSLHASAQDNYTSNIGLGFGLDYGGFGGKYTYLPAPAVGLFAGLGYNLAGLGYNFGAQYKFPSKTRTAGYLTGMYGYNGVIVVSGSITTSTVYYGPTLGGGIELTGRRNSKNFWNF